MIGIDIQDVDRFESYIGTDKMRRIFSRRELDYISKKDNRLETVAGIFCAKEAFFKAIGTGINGLNRLLEVEVGHLRSGSPYYVLSPEIIKQYNLSTSRIDLSISHTKKIAIAVCHFSRGIMI
jgi:phosphopantetheine--protein transferase-like protein